MMIDPDIDKEGVTSCLLPSLVLPRELRGRSMACSMEESSIKSDCLESHVVSFHSDGRVRDRHLFKPRLVVKLVEVSVVQRSCLLSNHSRGAEVGQVSDGAELRAEANVRRVHQILILVEMKADG